MRKKTLFASVITTLIRHSGGMQGYGSMRITQKPPRPRTQRDSKGLLPTQTQRAKCQRTRSPPVSRNDTETPLVAATSMPVGPSLNAGTPIAGDLLHEQVVMSAHMQYVTRLLGRAEKLRFFMDQESGLRAASLTSIDRFFMQVRRALTVAERGVISASADRLAVVWQKRL
jgi:hypothetical protein